MKLFFIGSNGQNNLGDDFLLNVFFFELGELFATWYINSLKPRDTEKQLKNPGVVVFRAERNPIKFLISLSRSDIIIIGGGSVIKELYPAYGSKRYSTLNKLSFLTWSAKIFNKPLVLQI